MAERQMILSGFFYNPQGDHRLSWRHPEAAGAEVLDFDYYRALAESAERARFDVMFVADHVGIWDSFASGVAHYANVRLEPVTLLSALAAVTRHIGLIGTASTSYTEPYNLARMFASLDFISRGRAGWNVVTSAMDEEALNYGRDGTIEHANRYARAGECIDVVTGLWDSWEEGAVLIDKASGLYADATRVHRIDHQGANFKVRGPLNIARPPQGHPLIVQAGSSEAGKTLAATYADVHFAIIRTLDEATAYRRDLDARLAGRGRLPDSFKILPGVLPIVATSAAEAQDRQAEFEGLMLDRVAIDLLSDWSGLDLSARDPDGPMPALPDEASFDGVRTMLQRVRHLTEQDLSIGQIARKLANTGSVPTLAGTAKQVADQLEAWFISGAVDGFNLMFPLLPGDWFTFAEQVVPELQRRGLVRRDYGPGTLRERLGLARPRNRFAS